MTDPSLRIPPSRFHSGSLYTSWPLIAGHDMAMWKQLASQINIWREEQSIQPMRLTIVLPFVQLVAPLRYIWGEVIGNGFLPRIETTQTWSARIGGIHHAGAGPSMDPVLDHLQAKPWLEKLTHQEALKMADALIEPLVQMATDLVHAAGAVPLQERPLYWERAQNLASHIPDGVAGVEAALGPLSVAWARATESWATDVLFEAAEQSYESAQNGQKNGLVIVQAGGEEALSHNLYQQWEETSRLWVNLDSLFTDEGLAKVEVTAPEQTQSTVQIGLFDEVKDDCEHEVSEGLLCADPLLLVAQGHPPHWQVALDAEEEAGLTAARVIQLLNAGVAPIALCSQDRPTARRVWALLQRQDIALADETGWTLSTTRCAALIMSLVNAAKKDATPDAILDAFKGFPPDYAFVRGLDRLESYLRLSQITQWPEQALKSWGEDVRGLIANIHDLLCTLRGVASRTLWHHLQVLEHVLKASSAWSILMVDEAGREIIQVLQLQEPADTENGQQENFFESAFQRSAQQTMMSYADFTRWMGRTLESVTFIPPRPETPQVVLTPLARLMLRPFAAVVIPGCDDSRLTVPPALPGFWTEADRIALGVMSRAVWWERLQAQWLQALRASQVFLLWRSSEGSQPLGPATLVQRVLPDLPPTPDQRVCAEQIPVPTWTPAPQPAERFPVQVLSASSYKKLRDCPYKFFAEYLLGLSEQEEFEVELTRRDYGNWLHDVLRKFHSLRVQIYPEADRMQDVALLEQCAAERAKDLDQASLIPWQARWPHLRDAYLDWLQEYENKGGRFVKAEFAMQYTLSDELVLRGRIDRLDELQGKPVLMDYKTESCSDTQKRVRNRYEEVQLPFYALLAQGKMTDSDAHIPCAEQAQAAYLSLDERQEHVESYAVDALEELKTLLARSMLDDIHRLKSGFPAYPLGELQICGYCKVMGLCRKPYWTEVVSGFADSHQEGE